MNLQRLNKTAVFVYVTLVLIGVWWIMPLFMHGIFNDGVYYGCISRNLAFDAGATLWDLKVSNNIDYNFNGHPPFAFWLQALFFRLVGDVFWVERCYSLLCAILTIGLIRRCWQFFFKSDAILPVFLWLSIPVIGWSFANNMLENTMTVCTTAAVYVQLLATRKRRWFGYTALGALFVFLATLTKGPVGLFPLAFWGIYALVMDRTVLKKAMLSGLFSVVLVALAYLVLCGGSERALVFFERYIDIQLLTSISGQDSIAGHRLFLLGVLLEEFIPIFILLLLSFVLHKKYVGKAIAVDTRTALFWFTIAFSASLPMLLSPKQLRFYIVPSTVFYVLGIATVLRPLSYDLKQRFCHFVKLNVVLRIVLLGGFSASVGLSVFNYAKVARNSELLTDVLKMAKVVPPKSVLKIPAELYPIWNLHAYMYRYYYIDLKVDDEGQEYAIGNKNTSVPAGFSLVEKDKNGQLISFDNYKLYQRKKD